MTTMSGTSCEPSLERQQTSSGEWWCLRPSSGQTQCEGMLRCAVQRNLDEDARAAQVHGWHSVRRSLAEHMPMALAREASGSGASSAHTDHTSRRLAQFNRVLPVCCFRVARASRRDVTDATLTLILARSTTVAMTCKLEVSRFAQLFLDTHEHDLFIQGSSAEVNACIITHSHTHAPASNGACAPEKSSV